MNELNRPSRGDALSWRPSWTPANWSERTVPGCGATRGLRSVRWWRVMGWVVVIVGLGVGAGSGFAKGELQQYLKKPEGWFATAEAQRVAGSVLSHQSDWGGWPKNTDTSAAPFTGERSKLQPTFDNGATTDELRLLARVWNGTSNAVYRRAFEKGYDYILKAQYPTGGWPQFYPPPAKTYHRHLTFNDDAMVRLMGFLRESWSSDRYGFLDDSRKQAARAAFERGVECILRCQIKVEGRLTAWCAQHDEKDFSPRSARAYELVSLSGAESVGIVRLLMSLEAPSPEVVRAIEGAVAWFETAQLKGLKVVQVDDPQAPKGKDRRVIEDPAAAPLWARFYEIGSNRPIYCDRDGVAKFKLSEIGYERRNGYSWLGSWPQAILAKEYPAWKERWGAGPGRKATGNR